MSREITHLDNEVDDCVSKVGNAQSRLVDSKQHLNSFETLKNPLLIGNYLEKLNATLEKDNDIAQTIHTTILNHRNSLEEDELQALSDFEKLGITFSNMSSPIYRGSAPVQNSYVKLGATVSSFVLGGVSALMNPHITINKSASLKNAQTSDTTNALKDRQDMFSNENNVLKKTSTTQDIDSRKDTTIENLVKNYLFRVSNSSKNKTEAIKKNTVFRVLLGKMKLTSLLHRPISITWNGLENIETVGIDW